MPQRRASIDQIRRFNRHYIPLMRLLDRSYLDTSMSTLETDILIEIGEHEGCSARDLCRQLGVDKGYLSRTIHRFEGEGLVRREPSADDARLLRLSLTEAGHARVADLADAGAAVVEEAFGGVGDGELAQVADALAFVLGVLEEGADGDE